jgi:hypothetical protein
MMESPERNKKRQRVSAVENETVPVVAPVPVAESKQQGTEAEMVSDNNT